MILHMTVLCSVALQPTKGVTNVLQCRYLVLLWADVRSSWMTLEGDRQDPPDISADNAVTGHNTVGM
jgi:hypothetical protein